ncbi:hypothetical protein Vretimale_8583 [Volvox reticuliferus]|nr:hypothetical protein Vretifemale_6513 [Volvox reticuliferus]GIM03927.1 hypothetical protein Vretimale_8583 [Volvox reticuliferus]
MDSWNAGTALYGRSSGRAGEQERPWQYSSLPYSGGRYLKADPTASHRLQTLAVATPPLTPKLPLLAVQSKPVVAQPYWRPGPSGSQATVLQLRRQRPHWRRRRPSTPPPLLPLPPLRRQLPRAFPGHHSDLRRGVPVAGPGAATAGAPPPLLLLLVLRRLYQR